jgi:ABC-type branched-subunit amino acid transport system ATPase component
MTMLEANDLFAGYGKTEILHGVSLQLAEKEIITIIGPNGAGKSTLLKPLWAILRFSKERFSGKAKISLPLDRIKR